jgi:hypothetical protein
MLKPTPDVIIFKLSVKKTTASGIYLPDNPNQTLDKKYIDEAEVFLAGDNVKSVKPGQKVVLTGRPMLPLPIEKYLGEAPNEEIMYARGKEEDVVCVIEDLDIEIK